MNDSTLAELEAFQRRFGDVLRTPLRGDSGTLRAAIDEYDRAALSEVLPGPSLSAGERLAVYNRQYWFRLFTLVHGEFRLTTALVGPWLINQWASRFFIETPPRDHDLGEALAGFDRFLHTHLPASPSLGANRPSLPRAALLEAASIDQSFRVLLSAPALPEFRLAPTDLARLATARLVASPAALLVDEHWPLVDLRRRLVEGPSPVIGEQPVALPEPLASMRTWALINRPHGLRVVPLAPLQAALLRRLAEHPVAEALALVERECPPADRPALIRDTQIWLTQGVKLGLWSGLEDAP
ncbi:putative DNA-binding domain-containing protein [Nannocystaceae bacterium ST9]